MKRIILFTVALSVISSADALITEKKAEELVEKEKTKMKNEITQQFQQEKSKLENELAIAQSEQRTSAEALKMSQEDNQKLQEEVNTKEQTISENNQRIQELQSQVEELNNVKSQLEQKTVEFDNLTKTSNEDLSRITMEKDKKIRELEEKNATLQSQSQQQVNDANMRSTEEINRMKGEIEQKSRELEEQKRTLQNKTQQQIYEMTNRNNEEINKIRSECEQKVKELENQKDSQTDTIKNQEETIKAQNLKIDELIAGGNLHVQSENPSVNATDTLTLLDCLQFANRTNNTVDNNSQHEIPVQELSEIDLKKTESRCLAEITNFQENVQNALVNVVKNQQEIIKNQKNKEIVWSQVDANDLEIDYSGQ